MTQSFRFFVEQDFIKSIANRKKDRIGRTWLTAKQIYLLDKYITYYKPEHKGDFYVIGDYVVSDDFNYSGHNYTFIRERYVDRTLYDIVFNDNGKTRTHKNNDERQRDDLVEELTEEGYQPKVVQKIVIYDNFFNKIINNIR